MLPEAWLAALAPTPNLMIVAAAAFAAGIVRGFSGFGTAMVFVPLSGAATNPVAALIMLQMIDTLPMVPLFVRATRKCAWREVLPIVAAATFTVPVGVYILKTADPIVLRWSLSGVILLLVLILASGWRYRKPPNLIQTFGVGALSGVGGGIAGLSGPPAILFWMAGQSNAERVRANMIIFLGCLTVVSITVLLLNGLFTTEAVVRGVALMPVYGLALWLGSRMFGMASESTFRRIAFGLIMLAAVLSVPALDGVIRPAG